jgi:ribokinase
VRVDLLEEDFHEVIIAVIQMQIGEPNYSVHRFFVKFLGIANHLLNGVEGYVNLRCLAKVPFPGRIAKYWDSFIESELGTLSGKQDRPGILVVGSINTDYVVTADRLPVPGESVVGTDFFQAFGGKGANQAVGIARLGVSPVTFVAAIGDDEVGARGVASLRNENVDCRFVRVIPEIPSGVALIMLDSNGENCIVAAPGANARVDREYIETLDESVFINSALVVVCQEVPLEAIELVLRRAAGHGVKTLLNPAPPHPGLRDAGILSGVNYLTPNETEVAAILDPGNYRENHLGNHAAKVLAVEQLCELGASNVAITMGAQGCFVFDCQLMNRPSDAVQVPAPRVNAVDTTAAGDAFNAAVAVGIYRQMTFLEACRWGNQVAAISVTRKGAQPSLPRSTELLVD